MWMIKKKSSFFSLYDDILRIKSNIEINEKAFFLKSF